MMAPGDLHVRIARAATAADQGDPDGTSNDSQAVARRVTHSCRIRNVGERALGATTIQTIGGGPSVDEGTAVVAQATFVETGALSIGGPVDVVGDIEVQVTVIIGIEKGTGGIFKSPMSPKYRLIR